MSAMDGKIGQCVCIKFCMELGKSSAEILEMLRDIFREHSLRQTAVYEWQFRFKVS
jgi:hypothetical protein